MPRQPKTRRKKPNIVWEYIKHYFRNPFKKWHLIVYLETTNKKSGNTVNANSVLLYGTKYDLYKEAKDTAATGYTVINVISF